MLKILAWKTWYVRYLCARSVASILSIEHIKMNYDFSQNSTLPGSTKFRKVPKVQNKILSFFGYSVSVISGSLIMPNLAEF